MKSPRNLIRVVDLFAGPGGLSEGFASCHRYRGGNRRLVASPYSTALAVEKDPHATRTLRLREMRRLLEVHRLLSAYDDAVAAWARGQEPDSALQQKHPNLWSEAVRHVQQIELGPSERDRVIQVIDESVEGHEWVLLGGPPCQAYSLAGRSRNKGIENYLPEEDERQTLYEEFLHVLAQGEPAAFVLENVKGLLSASLPDRQIFSAMLQDLADPCRMLRDSANRLGRRPRYRLFSLVTGREIQPRVAEQGDLINESSDLMAGGDPTSCLVRMEDFGVPQARHRVLVLGLLETRFGDISADRIRLKPVRPRPNVEDVLNTLPALRSGLSRGHDCQNDWRRVVRSALGKPWFESLHRNGGASVAAAIKKSLEPLHIPGARRGSLVVEHDAWGRTTGDPTQAWKSTWEDWYCRSDFKVFPNHESRGHMDSDLHRYLFAAAYGQVHGTSPHLRDFPRAKFPMGLLPDHANVHLAIDGTGNFGDRFRVQVATKPSRTITSHIAKDGHYYIHYDPEQCRSLTVREAARLQTFPDDYVFLGPRTEQYRQVGNAVPPYLSAQVALILYDLLRGN